MATPQIFISYRRQDTVGSAGRLFDRLADRFGRDHVYRDVDAAEAGEDFVATIRRRVDQCNVLLALIGPGWLKVTDESGGWRLAQEDDLVRIEIATALDRNIRVIPVLLQGATMPRAEDLPGALAKLAHRNAVEVRDTHFDQDVALLLDTLTPRWHHRRWIRRLGRPAIWAGVAVLIATAGIAVAYLSQVVLTTEQARARLAQLDIPYTENAFVKAVELKDEQAIALFIRAGMNPNARSQNGATALCWAAANGQRKVMSALLKRGAKVDPALSCAAGNGQEEALRVLLDGKPSVEALNDALVHGAGRRDPAIVRTLMAQGADVNAQERGQTALMRAANRSNVETVRALLDRDADPNRTSEYGWTALHWAAVASAGSEDDALPVVRALLDKGAELDARSASSNYSTGWTPLLLALYEKKWRIARFLTELGADVNAQSQPADVDRDDSQRRNFTALMWAVNHGDAETVTALLAKGARIDARTQAGNTALSIAAAGVSAPIVGLLLARGADVNAANGKGWTSLMFAASENRGPNVSVLIDGGADVRLRTKAGSTVLMIAAERSSPDVVDALLSRGVDVNAVNDKGSTALMMAAFFGRTENARILVAKGANIRLRDNAGDTALDIARKEKSEDVVALLLAAAKTPGGRAAGR